MRLATAAKRAFDRKHWDHAKWEAVLPKLDQMDEVELAESEPYLADLLDPVRRHALVEEIAAAEKRGALHEARRVRHMLEHPEYYELKGFLRRCLRKTERRIRDLLGKHAAIGAELERPEDSDGGPKEELARVEDLDAALVSEPLDRKVRELGRHVRRLKRIVTKLQGQTQGDDVNRWKVRHVASLVALGVGSVIAATTDFRTGVVLLFIALYLRPGIS